MWFQSTHSLRSATAPAPAAQADAIVSIHALLAECDTYDFADINTFLVSIHALLAECDGVRELVYL